MAALIADAVAEQARARVLRADAAAFRFTARRRRRDAQKRHARCLTTWAHAERIRMRGLPSPWSALEWRVPDGELDRVVLAVPEDA